MCFVASKTKSAQLDRSATVVILVRRHTHNRKNLAGRTKGLHLNDLGKEQARESYFTFKSLNSISAVYSSPMERTFETAKPIAKLWESVRKHQGLIEADLESGQGASYLSYELKIGRKYKKPSLLDFLMGNLYGDAIKDGNYSHKHL